MGGVSWAKTKKTSCVYSNRTTNPSIFACIVQLALCAFRHWFVVQWNAQRANDLWTYQPISPPAVINSTLQRFYSVWLLRKCWWFPFCVESNVSSSAIRDFFLNQFITWNIRLSNCAFGVPFGRSTTLLMSARKCMRTRRLPFNVFPKLCVCSALASLCGCHCYRRSPIYERQKTFFVFLGRSFAIKAAKPLSQMRVDYKNKENKLEAKADREKWFTIFPSKLKQKRAIISSRATDKTVSSETHNSVIIN